MAALFRKPEYLFFVIAIAVGAYLSFITPVFEFADERGHATRALQFARGGWLGPFPVNRDLLREWQPESRNGKINPSVGSQHYLPAAYVFPVPAMFGTYHLGMPMKQIVFAGRFASLLGAAMLIFYAIRRTPRFKWAMAVASLLPMMVVIRSGINADGMVYGLALLFFSEIFRLRDTKEQVSEKSFMLMLVAVGLIALIKLPYAPLALAALLIPRECWGSAKSMLGSVAALFLFALLLGLGWALYLKANYLSTVISPEYGLYPQHPGIFPDRQLAFMLAYPDNFLRVLLGTLSNPGFWQGAWTSFLGPHTLELPVKLGISLLLVLSLYAEKGPETRIWARLFAALLFIGISLGILVLFYVQWTPVGDGRIIGFQGRYWYPILPLAFLILRR